MILARLPRYVIPGVPQHVIVRGNNREPVFGSNEDYQYYLELLAKDCRKENRGQTTFFILQKQATLQTI